MQSRSKRLREMLEADVPAVSVRGDPPVAVESVAHQHLEGIPALAASGDNGNNWRRDKSAVSQRPLSDAAALLQEKISALPVSRRYHAIFKHLETLPLVVIGADTGTGKTTQVPQIAADVVWSYYKRTGVWPGRVIVTLPTRVGVEALFWRFLDETDVQPGKLAALRTGTLQHGCSNAFLTVMTHGFLAKILDFKFLESVAFLILDEAHERTLILSFIKAMLKRCSSGTKVVLMGAGLDVASHISFFETHVGGLDVVGRQFPIQRFQLPALPEKMTGPNIDSEVIVRVEMLARAEMGLSRKCILVFVKGKADAEILAKKLEGPDWESHYCHAEAEEDCVKLILGLPDDAEGHVIVGTSFVESAITVPAICTVICSCRVNWSIVDAEGVSTNKSRWCSKLEIQNQTGRTGRTSPGKVLLAVPLCNLPAQSPSEASTSEDLRPLVLELARRQISYVEIDWPQGERPILHRYNRSCRELNEHGLVEVKEQIPTASVRGDLCSFEHEVLQLTPKGQRMYDLGTVTSFNSRNFICLCNDAGCGYQGAGAAALLEAIVSGQPFVEPQEGFTAARNEFMASNAHAGLSSTSDLLMLVSMFEQWRETRTDRKAMSRRWNLKTFVLRHAIATYTAIRKASWDWTDWRGDMKTLAVLMDKLMVEAAPQLVSFASVVHQSTHQTASGRYVKCSNEAAQSCNTIVPLDIRVSGGGRGVSSRARLAVLCKDVRQTQTAMVISDSFLMCGLSARVPEDLITGLLRERKFSEVVTHCKSRLRFSDAIAFLEKFDATVDVMVVVYNVNDAVKDNSICWPPDAWDKLSDLLRLISRKCKRLCFVVPCSRLFPRFACVAAYEKCRTEICCFLRDRRVHVDEAEFLQEGAKTYDGEHFAAECEGVLARAVGTWMQAAEVLT